MNWTSREEFANQQDRCLKTITRWLNTAREIFGEDYIKLNSETFEKKIYFTDDLCDKLKTIGKGKLIKKGDQRRKSLGTCKSPMISQNKEVINNWQVIPNVVPEIDYNRFKQPSTAALSLMDNARVGTLFEKSADDPSAAAELCQLIMQRANYKQQVKQLEERNKQLEYENKLKDTEIHIDTVQINNWINRNNRKSFLNMPDNM